MNFSQGCEKSLKGFKKVSDILSSVSYLVEDVDEKMVAYRAYISKQRMLQPSSQDA